jgi:hypothetical protein
MSKLLAVIVASTFALSAVPGFAKTEELTKDQRAELRNRAERLVAERNTNHAPVKAGVGHTPKVKKHPAPKEQPKT